MRIFSTLKIVTATISTIPIALLLIFLSTSSLQAQDSDNDSIPDEIDLDDDNDGILDADECPNNLINFGDNGTFDSGDSEWGPALSTAETEYNYSTGSSWPGNYNIIKSTESVDFEECCGVDVFRTLYDRTDPGNGYFAYFDMGVDDRGDALFTDAFGVNENTTYEISFWLAGPFKHIPNSTGIIDIEIDGIYFQTITIPDDSDWAYYSYSYTTPIGTTDILLEFINNSEGGTLGSDLAIDDIKIEAINFVCPDTDNDGIPDYLDLDSDNDGCPDYIEGGADFDFSDGVNAQGGLSDGNGGQVTQNLGVEVGSIPEVNLGVPIIAGYGQSIDDSQDASDNTCLDLASGSISGNIGEDTDGNNLPDQAMAGAAVSLFDSSFGLVEFVLTDGNGDYVFTDLLAGDYYIISGAAEGYETVSEGDNIPDATDDSGPNEQPINEAIEATLILGEVDEGNDFVVRLIDPCEDWEQSEANSLLSVGVVIAPGLVGTENDLVNINFVVLNAGTEALSNVELEHDVLYYTGLPTGFTLNPTFTGDPNNNGRLDVNEVWFYTAVANFPFEKGDSFVITCGATGNISCGEEIGAAAGLLFTSGINMDVNIEQDTVIAGDEIEVTLTTRLLIDEDAAINPGTTTIVVGGMEVEIELPATRWEARELMISASMLNEGIAFDPFDPPAGIEMTNFCEQDGSDSGRNLENVLDELEPIDTFRDPCEGFGEEDILCEYPEWVFCYSITIPEDFADSVLTVQASDDFFVWKAEEVVAGTGEFNDYIDITNIIETGGSDSASIVVVPSTTSTDLIQEMDGEQISFYPNPINDYLYIQSKQSIHELSILIYNLNGIKVLEKRVSTGDQIDLSELESGLYIVKAYDDTNIEIGTQQVSVIK